MDECIATKLGKRWTEIRTSVLSVVDTSGFEWMILIFIFVSSITLCFEDIYLEDNIFLKKILYWTNLGFCTLFSIEMLLKWLALGFCKYFTSFWTILDFIIVFVSTLLYIYLYHSREKCFMIHGNFHVTLCLLYTHQVSIFSLLIEENENLKVLRSLRTLRALRPLRAISRWQGMRVSSTFFSLYYKNKK